ncbi:MAG: hypothetical protein D6712_11400 [Chloroflexi bacterium]|nr:MAG: hypothetical protein D6712_11400 [Chloroflexota bacterium]
MGFIDILEASGDLSPRQRWSHVFTVAFALACIFLGIILRNNTLFATTHYVDVEAGIEAEYPANWLLDTDGDYVFRVRDMTRLDFKTVIQVSLEPISPDNPNGRNILDALSLVRSQTLTAYDASAIEDYVLPDGSPALSMAYTFVDKEVNPLLDFVPTVVIGTDILVIKRGQAIIITFQSDERGYDENIAIFQRFLESLDF